MLQRVQEQNAWAVPARYEPLNLIRVRYVVTAADIARLPDQQRLIADAVLSGRPHPLARYWADPAQVLFDGKLPPNKGWSGGPTDYQVRVMRSHSRRILIIAARQIGKTEADIGWAIWTMLCRYPALVLVLFPSLRQSKKFVRRFRKRFMAGGFESRARILLPANSSEVRLDNGSAMLAMPHSEATILGEADVHLLVIDEAARVSDELYHAVLPMTDVNDGRILASSTALYKQGWFWRAYQDAKFGARELDEGEQEMERAERWEVHTATVWDCPWTDRVKMLARQRQMPARVFEQNYLCGFADVEGGVFREQDIEAMFRRGAELPPMVF